MKELNHLQAQQLLQSGSPLPSEEKSNLAAHLAACAECRAYADFHARLAGDLPQAFPARRHSERELRQKISAAQAQLEKRSLPWQMLRYAQSALAMTAVLALVVGLGYLAFRSLPGGARQQASQPQEAAASPQPAAALLMTEPAAGEAIPASPDPFGTQVSQPALGGPPQATAFGMAASLLAEFPLHEGAAWRWQEESYSQAPDRPETILRATAIIEERVAAVEEPFAQATLIYIQGRKTLLSADEGWQENGEFPPGNYEYWYLVRGDQVYRSLSKPDADLANLDQLRLEYQFPLEQGAEWCRTGTVGQPPPGADAPCEARAVVSDVVTAQMALGEQSGCFEIHDVAVSGDGFTTYCPWLGVVAAQYAYGGTQSGYTRTLVEFSRDGRFSTPMPTPTPISGADLAAQLSGEVMGVAWHGRTAYIGAGPYLEAIDLTQPASPERIAQSPLLPDPVSKVIRIPDETAPQILAAYGRRLAVFDISDPRVIDPIGDFILPGKVTSLLLDLYTLQAYAAGPLEGQPSSSYLLILDLTEPAAPRLVDQITIEGSLTSIALTNMPGERTAADPRMLVIGSLSGVEFVRVENNRFGQPGGQVIHVPVYSMTVVSGQLTIGSNGNIWAYSLMDGVDFLWKLDEAAPGVPLGLVYGFELRASAIYAAGYYPDGSRPPFRLAISPPQPNQTGSTVDGSSVISVGNGLMLVSGDRTGGGLEIYDVRDPQNFQRVGSYQPAR